MDWWPFVVIAAVFVAALFVIYLVLSRTGL